MAWILPSVPRTPNPPGTRTPLHENEEIPFTQGSPAQLHPTTHHLPPGNSGTCKTALPKRALKCLGVARPVCSAVSRWLHISHHMKCHRIFRETFYKRTFYLPQVAWPTCSTSSTFANVSPSQAPAEEAAGCSVTLSQPKAQGHQILQEVLFCPGSTHSLLPWGKTSPTCSCFLG